MIIGLVLFIKINIVQNLNVGIKVIFKGFRYIYGINISITIVEILMFSLG